MSENMHKSEEKRGCAPLGCFIIIIAIAAVLFYFLIKPKLEERGITVASMQEKIVTTGDKVQDNISTIEGQLNNANEQAVNLREQTTETLDELSEDVKEKMPKAPIKLYEE